MTLQILIYTIHYYANNYKSIAKGKRLAIVVSSDIENFKRFNIFKKANAIAKESLKKIVNNCKETKFLQVKHNLLDTRIY